jgi:hypothetical protein
VLVQALPPYDDGATASRQRTIDYAISKIKFDKDESHHANFEQQQNHTNTEHNDIGAHAYKVLREVDGPQR